MGPAHGIRTRKGAELRKREAFSSAAREGRRPEAKAGGVSRTRHPSSPTTDLIGFQLWGPFFFGPSAWDSNPPGCGAEETRSVFQRSTRGAERRSGARAAPAARGHPSSPTTELLGLQRWRPFFFSGPAHGVRTRQHVCHKGRGQKMAKMSTATLLTTYQKIIFA